MGIKYRKGYKYQLVKDYECYVNIHPIEAIITKFIELYPTGKLIIKAFYAWDGTSGPTLDGKTNMRGSLIHDACYQLMREQQLSQDSRKQADIEFYKACIEDGMTWIRAEIDLVGLRKFGASSADPLNDRKILTAP